MPDGKTIYRFNRGPTALNKYAYWHFYVLGTKEDGLIGLVKMYASAWVVDSLKANCLLSNAWMHP